jgi:glycosyltransferase involved in cell wall biosynthesis
MAASVHHDVWLLTSTHQREVIEQGLRHHRPPGLVAVHYVEDDDPSLDRADRSGGRYRGNSRLHYRRWQRAARRSAQRLHAEHGFELAHHLTWGVDWQPAAAASLPGLPFVWGPVGGASPPAFALARWLGVRGVATELVREAVTRVGRRAFGRRLAREATLVLAQNRYVAEALPHEATVVVAPAPGLDTDTLQAAAHPEEGAGTPPDEGPTTGADERHAVLSGRMHAWKGVLLAVATMAHAPHWRLDLYGSGPAVRPARRLANRLGVQNRVTFHGNRPRTEVLRATAMADALLLPSVHDSAPWAAAEAVSLGTPVVCLESGGTPGVARVPEGGRAVPVSRRADHALAAALDDLPPLDPVDWWRADRLPDQVATLYERALTGGPSAVLSGSGS